MQLEELVNNFKYVFQIDVCCNCEIDERSDVFYSKTNQSIFKGISVHYVVSFSYTNWEYVSIC